MATQEYWNIVDKSELWPKVVGRDTEDPFMTMLQANKIFDGIAGESCLEIGAGVGRLLKLAVIPFCNAIGIDYSKSMVERSVEYLWKEPRAKVVLVNGTEFPFPSNSFDFVYSFTCFQHMPELRIIQKNLEESARILRPGGRCRIQTVLGRREVGLHDGYVFESRQEFSEQFELVGLRVNAIKIEDSWVWITAKKPANE